MTQGGGRGEDAGGLAFFDPNIAWAMDDYSTHEFLLRDRVHLLHDFDGQREGVTG